MQLVAPRGLSTRPTPIARSGAPRLGGRRARRGRSSSRVEELERLPQLERALLEPRLDVAGGARSGDGGSKPS